MASDLLPTGWRLAKLGELGEVNRGRSRHRPRYAEHLYGGPYPFIQTGDVKNSGGRITTFEQTYSEEGLAQSRLWPAGTMCITIAANIAETGILTFPACFPDSVVGFVADESKCDVRFVEFMFRHLRQRIQHEASGSVQDNINLATLERLRFPLPPLPEQRAIAHILGALDDKIELNRRMSEALEGMARALFKSWFVDFEPVRSKSEGRDPGLPKSLADLFPDSFEDSALGEIPKGWEPGTIGSIAVRVMDKVDRPTDWAQKPLIDLSRMPQGSIALSEWGRGEELTTSVTTFRPGDTLFGAIRPYFHKVGVAPIEGVTNVSVLVLRARQFNDWPYLAILCSLADTVEYATRVARGTKMPVVSWRDLQAYACALPPAVARSGFGQLAGPLLREIQVHIQMSHTLAAIRDALLPRLISGALRVGEYRRVRLGGVE